MKYIAILTALLSAFLAVCTSVNVRPIPSRDRIKEVIINKNPKVAVDDFLDVLADGFHRHGITTKVTSADAEWKDSYVVNYVAYRNWDLAPYLTDATISIDRNGRRVAEASYHLKGKGGLSLTKWQGTKAKMDPVIDELLKNVGTK